MRHLFNFRNPMAENIRDQFANLAPLLKFLIVFAVLLTLAESMPTDRSYLFCSRLNQDLFNCQVLGFKNAYFCDRLSDLKPFLSCLKYGHEPLSSHLSKLQN